MWLHNIPMKDNNQKFHYLCSDHFELTAFTNTMKRRLLPESVPTIQKQGICMVMKHSCLPAIDNDK